jgi:hypothetical protein
MSNLAEYEYLRYQLRVMMSNHAQDKSLDPAHFQEVLGRTLRLMRVLYATRGTVKKRKVPVTLPHVSLDSSA